MLKLVGRINIKRKRSEYKGTARRSRILRNRAKVTLAAARQPRLHQAWYGDE